MPVTRLKYTLELTQEERDDVLMLLALARKYLDGRLARMESPREGSTSVHARQNLKELDGRAGELAAKAAEAVIS
jgi:hypothetical protein